MFLQKKLILAVLLSAVALLPLGAVAQQRNFVSFSGGYSLPVGAFASQNFGDPKAGLAGSGVYAQLNYERRLTDHFGLRVTGSLNINQTDAQPLIDEYSVLLPKPDSYSWQKETSTWQLGALLLGPSGYLPLGKVELEGHVQAGVVLAESPSVTLFGISAADSPDVEASVTQASTTAFGFGAGASVRFRMTDNLRLQLTADAIGADMQLKDVTTYRRFGSFVIQETTSPSRFVTVVNVGAGVVLGF